MDENIYPTPKSSGREMYTLASAVRRYKTSEGKKNETSKNTSQIRNQVQEIIKNVGGLAVLHQPRIRAPLNMIVSKTATRRPIEEQNLDPLQGFDMATIRNTKLAPPPWRDMQVHTKRLQSAYNHNKRLIQQIQAKKAQLVSCPDYEPKKLVPKQRYRDVKHLMAEMQSKSLRTTNLSSQEENFHQLCAARRSWPTVNNTSPKIISEDPLPSDITSDNVFYEQQSNKDESFTFDPTLMIQEAKNNFAWNPFVLSTSYTSCCGIDFFKDNCDTSCSDSDIFKDNCGPQNIPYFENKARNLDVFDSPGNHTTTSSTSSGVTVAEESLQLTYFAKRCNCQSKKFAKPTFNSKSLNESEIERCFYCPAPDFQKYFEE